MKELQILVNNNFDFAINIEDKLVFISPIDFVDVLEVMDLLCKNFDIEIGDATLSLYKYLDRKIREIRAEKEEFIMNKEITSRVF
jgi:acyl carrier protein